MKNFDNYYDPPDEPEAVYCEECGKEKIEIDHFEGMRDFICVNDFCPANFSGVSQEMAIALVDALEELETANWKIKRLKAELSAAYGDNTQLHPK